MSARDGVEKSQSAKQLHLGKINEYKKKYLRIGSCAKLAPRYCGPFEILERIVPVAYQLALPPTVKVHDVSIFHCLRSI